jgi:hypothetical protein
MTSGRDVLAAWRHESDRLPPQRPRSARPPGVRTHPPAGRRDLPPSLPSARAPARIGFEATGSAAAVCTLQRRADGAKPEGAPAWTGHLAPGTRSSRASTPPASASTHRPAIRPGHCPVGRLAEGRRLRRRLAGRCRRGRGFPAPPHWPRPRHHPLTWAPGLRCPRGVTHTAKASRGLWVLG